MVTHASVVEVCGAFRKHRIEQRRIALHQATPSQQLGALPQPWTRDFRGSANAQTVDGSRLAVLKQRRLYRAQGIQRIAQSEISCPTCKRFITTAKNGPGGIHPVTSTPLTAGSPTDLRSGFEYSHDESTSLKFVCSTQSGEPRTEHGNATWRRRHRVSPPRLESTARTSCKVSKAT